MLTYYITPSIIIIMGTYALLKRWKLQYYPGNTNKLWDH
jgi:hypothetical protein